MSSQWNALNKNGRRPRQAKIKGTPFFQTPPMVPADKPGHQRPRLSSVTLTQESENVNPQMATVTTAEPQGEIVSSMSDRERHEDVLNVDDDELTGKSCSIQGESSLSFRTDGENTEMYLANAGLRTDDDDDDDDDENEMSSCSMASSNVTSSPRMRRVGKVHDGADYSIGQSITFGTTSGPPTLKLEKGPGLAKLSKRIRRKSRRVAADRDEYHAGLSVSYASADDEQQEDSVIVVNALTRSQPIATDALIAKAVPLNACLGTKSGDGVESSNITVEGNVVGSTESSSMGMLIASKTDDTWPPSASQLIGQDSKEVVPSTKLDELRQPLLEPIHVTDVPPASQATTDPAHTGSPWKALFCCFWW
ncbi:Uncharacterized protein PBTT_02191 [Plasmodiophora brassicae]